MKSIKYTCSLGTLCQTSEVLKNNNLKLCSYPFDWIFSDTNTILDCLQDNFTKFLDSSFYINNKHQFNPRQCGHSIYHEDFFFHKNPRNIDDYNYYTRCVKRFKNLLSNKEEKLFMSMIVPDATRHPKHSYEDLINNPDVFVDKIKNEFIRFNHVFKNYTTDYNLLVIINLVKEQQKFLTTQVDNINFIELHTVSQSNGVKFLQDTDNNFLNQIIKQEYVFDLIKEPHAKC